MRLRGRRRMFGGIGRIEGIFSSVNFGHGEVV
jgi:hypothetical protein